MESKVTKPGTEKTVKVQNKRLALLKGLEGLPLMTGFGGALKINMSVKNSEGKSLLYLFGYV